MHEHPNVSFDFFAFSRAREQIQNLQLSIEHPGLWFFGGEVLTMEILKAAGFLVNSHPGRTSFGVYWDHRWEAKKLLAMEIYATWYEQFLGGV